jgi:hypothetical protein
MSDPHHPDPKTRRANPLQPDRPSPEPDAPASPDHDADESARRRSEHALDNVREGYGGPKGG